MIIFITQKQLIDKNGAIVDGLERSYINFFSSYGILVPIPNNVIQIHRFLRAHTPDFNLSPTLIILTGGNNINPESYGSNERLDDLAPIRDKIESTLLEYALDKNIPVIGICRGFHFINVYLGGKLNLYLPNHSEKRSHLCKFEGGNYIINSYHNHGVMLYNLSTKLTPIAYTEHTLIEAYTGKNKRILGVQWHPERPGCEKGLFEELVKRYLKI